MAVDDTYTKLLLHMDGTDNSTTFIEESGKIVTPVGNACIKTSQKKFGDASAYFDGSGDNLSVTNSAEELSFGTGDFTIDCWIYLLQMKEQMIYASATAGDISWGFSSSGLMTLLIRDVVELGSVASGIVINTWNHVAIVRNNGVVSFYVNGIKLVGFNSSYNLKITNILTIGSWGTKGYFYGYIDELRVSKGIARWTTNFIPSMIPYSSDTTKTFPIEFLVVGGGGGGGKDIGGGGGGGGVVFGTTQVTAGSYSITVGTGGVQGTYGRAGNSAFESIIAHGGGNGGGATPATVASIGASGGGGYCGATGANALPGLQGKAGGYGLVSSPYFVGGGGGGYSEIGSNATTAKGGKGGEGYTSSISGTSRVYGSGGGGSWLNNAGTTGTLDNLGLGGTNAGNGGISKGATPIISATSAMANSGCGGGGGGWQSGANQNGGNGGSGIVIVRYKTVDFNGTGGTISIDGEYTIHTFITNDILVLLNRPKYKLSGTALLPSNIIPMLTYNSITSAINWTANIPEGTSLNIKIAIGETEPSDGNYIEVANNGKIPNLTIDASGKMLYIKAYLSTTDELKTPKLINLSYSIEQTSDSTLQINLTESGKMESPVGNVNVSYEKTNGNLQSLSGVKIESFNKDFIPQNL